MKAAVLFCRSDSIYKELGADCWDAARDARNYSGPAPIVAHPPCRGWGNLRQFSKASAEEKALGPWAVSQVRTWGGVLEHPRGSSLWAHCSLPRPGAPLDAFGGFSICVHQFWWGHRALKPTWLYICGIPRADLPAHPLVIGRAPRVITNMRGIRRGHPAFRPEVTMREREATPPDFARWLLLVASMCRPACVEVSA